MYNGKYSSCRSNHERNRSGRWPQSGMSVASMSSTISVGGASCDSMNRSTSRRSMASRRVPYPDSASCARSTPAGSACSCRLAAPPACACRSVTQAADQNATARGRSGPRSPSPARRFVARASAPRCRHAPGSRPSRKQSARRLSRLILQSTSRQRRTAIAGHLAGGKTCLHTARKMGCKCERSLVTLCHQKGRSVCAVNYASTTQLCHEKDGLSKSLF